MGLRHHRGNQEDRENKQGRHREEHRGYTEKDTEKESKQGEHREGQGEDAGKDAEKTNRGTQTD